MSDVNKMLETIKDCHDELVGCIVAAEDRAEKAERERDEALAYLAELKRLDPVAYGAIHLRTVPPTEDDLRWAREVAE